MLLAISNSQIELSTHKTPNYLHPSSLTPCHVYVNVSTSNNFFNESWLCTHVNSIFLGFLQKGLCFIHPTNHYRMSTVCRLLPWPLVSSSSLRSAQSLNPVSVSLLHHQAFEGRPGAQAQVLLSALYVRRYFVLFTFTKQPRLTDSGPRALQHAAFVTQEKPPEDSHSLQVPYHSHTREKSSLDRAVSTIYM